MKAFKTQKSDSGIADSVTLSGSHHSTCKLEVIKKKSPFLLHRAGVKITKGRCAGRRSSDFLGRGLRGNLGPPMLHNPAPSPLAPGKSQLRQVRELMPFPAGFAPDDAPPVPRSGLTPGMPPRALPWPQALPTSPAPILSPKCLYRPPPTPQSPLEPSSASSPPQLPASPFPTANTAPIQHPLRLPFTTREKPLGQQRSNLRLKGIKPDLNRRK